METSSSIDLGRLQSRLRCTSAQCVALPAGTISRPRKDVGESFSFRCHRLLLLLGSHLLLADIVEDAAILDASNNLVNYEQPRYWTSGLGLAYDSFRFLRRPPPKCVPCTASARTTVFAKSEAEPLPQ